MKKIIKPIVCMFAIALFFIPSSLVVKAKEQRVFDNANLFSNSEISNLEEKIDDLKDEYPYDFFIITSDELNTGSKIEMADSYFEMSSKNVKGEYSAYLLYVNIKTSDVYLLTCGKAEKYLQDEEFDNAIDSVKIKLTNGNYYTAGKVFLDKSEENIENNIKKFTPFEFIIVFGISALVFIIFIFSVKAKYGSEGKANPYQFKERGKVSLTRSEDIFVREYVTSVKIPKSTGGGGGSSSHTASSGRSIGGGSRKF